MSCLVVSSFQLVEVGACLNYTCRDQTEDILPNPKFMSIKKEYNVQTKGSVSMAHKYDFHPKRSKEDLEQYQKVKNDKLTITGVILHYLPSNQQIKKGRKT